MNSLRLSVYTCVYSRLCSFSKAINRHETSMLLWLDILFRDARFWLWQFDIDNFKEIKARSLKQLWDLPTILSLLFNINQNRKIMAEPLSPVLRCSPTLHPHKKTPHLSALSMHACKSGFLKECVPKKSPSTPSPRPTPSPIPVCSY